MAVDPIQRRRALIQKIMGAGGKASPGMGTPAKLSPGTVGRGVPRTAMTQSHGVAQAVQALLGPGGFGQANANEASQAHGAPVRGNPGIPLPQAPQMPLPGGGPGNSPIPGATASDPGLTPVGSPAAPTSGGDSQVQGIYGPTVDPGSDLFPSDAVHLGGGIYFSPTAGYINMGSSNGNIDALGQAARGSNFNRPV